jgi:hypothetical protein
MVGCAVSQRRRRGPSQDWDVDSDGLVILFFVGLVIQVFIMALAVRWGVAAALRYAFKPGTYDRSLLVDALREADDTIQQDRQARVEYENSKR